jgi:hypothetical protein
MCGFVILETAGTLFYIKNSEPFLNKKRERARSNNYMDSTVPSAIGGGQPAFLIL